MNMFSSQLMMELLEFRHERDWKQFHNARNLATALSIEVAELQEIFLWINDEDINSRINERKNAIEQEVADIAIYLLRICMKLDINLEDAILNKMTKNEAKYPVESSMGGSKKYSKSREDK